MSWLTNWTTGQVCTVRNKYDLCLSRPVFYICIPDISDFSRTVLKVQDLHVPATGRLGRSNKILTVRHLSAVVAGNF